MTVSTVAFAAALLGSTANAGRMPLASLNRLHGGLAITDSASGLGGIVGMDSRLTRLVFVDLGGFFTPGDQKYDSSINPETQDPSEWYTLRSGLYAAPGLRIPHRYQDGFNWDVVGRAGFAALWIADESQRIIPDDEALVYSEAGLLLGADVLLRFDEIGVRMSGKAYGWHAYSPVKQAESNTIRPQFTIEGVYQF
ncbi:MAG: hypothetical protein CL927_06545 [Deltaproteobacteria bacterium]|nr:hypothetical protein [Deltaproteobacteria bacterium]HCH66062.1 hypothetical protein [Deltaproteobacteria bacterium]